MYHSANLVCEAEGTAAAVLIRALEPASGNPDLRLNGPGLLCKSLGIHRGHDGLDVLDEESEIRLEYGSLESGEEVISSRRVGLSFEDELDWRICIAGNKHVSRGRPGVVVKRSRK